MEQSVPNLEKRRTHMCVDLSIFAGVNKSQGNRNYLAGLVCLTKSRMRAKSTGFPLPSIIIGSNPSPPYSNWITYEQKRE